MFFVLPLTFVIVLVYGQVLSYLLLDSCPYFFHLHRINLHY